MTLTVLLAFVAALAFQSPAGRSPRPETGEIRGRVTEKGTGQPIARALVRLNKIDTGEAVSARTDDQGQYRFEALSTGQYGGFVEGEEHRAAHIMGPLRDRANPRMGIDVRAGEVREINVELLRASAFTVRVVDDAAQPLSGVGVALIAQNSGRVAWTPWQRKTDDRGRLRLFRLEPGRYSVCAEVQHASGGRADAPARRREGWLRTCYPSAQNETEAEVVDVGTQELDEIEIRMQWGRLFSVSGIVIDSTGAPLSGALVGLTRFVHRGSSSTSTRIEKDGRFSFSSVPRGDYAIEVQSGGPNRPEQRRDEEEAFHPIRVEAADIDGLVVTLAKTVQTAGRIRLEDPTATLPSAPGSAGLMVWTRLADDRFAQAGNRSSGMLEKDRTFVLRRLTGKRTIDAVNVPRGWFVKSIQYEGKEIIDDAVEFKNSSDPSGLEIILSTRGAFVTGRVHDDRGEAAARARVAVFPVDRTHWRVSMLSTTAASQTGAFRIGPLRGGEYFVAVIRPGDPEPSPLEHEPWALLAEGAQRITLGDEQERSIDLRLPPKR